MRHIYVVYIVVDYMINYDIFRKSSKNLIYPINRQHDQRFKVYFFNKKKSQYQTGQ